MLYAGRLLIVLAAVAASAVAYPNHLKAVVTGKEVVPVPQASGVAASFGPFSAKAGVGEGGLYASADSPLGNAGAGVGSGGLGAGASTGGAVGAPAGGADISGGGGHTTQHKPGHHQPGLFDGIFNIPISVLQAVNQYLNNRGPITKPVHRRRGHEPVYKTVTPEKSGGAAEPGAGAEARAVCSAGEKDPVNHSPASSSSGGSAGHSTVVHKRVNYDDIFAIPISTLKAVNSFLNGKK